MVSLALEVNVRKDYFAWILKLYSLAYKDKHPTKTDEEFYELTKVVFRDLVYEDKEERELLD